MGQTLATGLAVSDDLDVVALVDVVEPRERGAARYVTRLEQLNADLVDVVVDFSTPDGVVRSAQWCAEHGVALVVGATGLDPAQRASLDHAATRVGVIIAANYSIGAILSERFAALAAPYFDGVEIIELHHDRKIDAPSGTSLATARAIAAAREGAGLRAMSDPTRRHTVEGARGAEAPGGIKIHAVRLPGLTAHQEVLFGGAGEGLTIRHDSFDRSSFVHGVALAVRAVGTNPGLVDGIESLVA